MMRLLYRLAVWLAAPLVSLLFLWRGLRDRAWRRNFGERFGFGTRLPAGGVWLHAVSVGEVQACAPLVAALRQRHPDLPLLVTVVTPTGAARARGLFGSMAQVRYLPFDLPGAVRRFLRRVRPRLAVIIETELWPNLYRECGRQRIPLVMASARISPRSLRRYARLGSLFRDTLAQVSVLATQGEADAQRFRDLGARPDGTHVTGNFKFDFQLPADIEARAAQLCAALTGARALWVAGSTHAGEEQAVLQAHRAVLAQHAEALLIIAPRHPPRFDEVAQLLQQSGLGFARRSQTEGPLPPDCAVLLLDTLGELLEFYAAAQVAFVGGSLVPIGGHNLLEPAALGVPILTGPSNSNGAAVARLLIDSGAARIVRDPAELGVQVAGLLADPAARERMGAAGRAVVEANRGALDKLLQLIEPLLA